MHIAADANEYEVLEEMLRDEEAASVIDITDKHKNSAAHIAAHHGHYESFKFLVEAGARLTKKNVNGFNPRELAYRNEKLAPYMKVYDNAPKIRKKKKKKPGEMTTTDDESLADLTPTDPANTLDDLMTKQAAITERTIVEAVSRSDVRQKSAALPPNWNLRRPDDHTTSDSDTSFQPKKRNPPHPRTLKRDSTAAPISEQELETFRSDIKPEDYYRQQQEQQRQQQQQREKIERTPEAGWISV
ncbi:PREDICTED: uncharacterized protein LOC106817650 [Priapulus caudatus]|uniref:Uncharacterized protein LOC106817650 n=1 Tax=Priapulus caudatus TaxID=37621 RepID=A0ABM1F052_PRICU|nr:PREDICTED: uncharacterized protein LOC106817650 [Priapulus caudatus]